MAKPNYSFEKRQRELAKKKKKEGKLAERAARKTGDGPDDHAPLAEGGMDEGLAPSAGSADGEGEGPAGPGAAAAVAPPQ